MKSAIEKIFFLEHPHFENIEVSPRYSEILNKIYDLLKKLGGEITAEQNQMLNEIDSLQGALCGESELATYIAGFKLGLQVGAEAFKD